jgi:hypothetical protein
MCMRCQDQKNIYSLAKMAYITEANFSEKIMPISYLCQTNFARFFGGRFCAGYQAFNIYSKSLNHGHY